MTRTSPAVLAIAAVLGAGAGFLLDQLLTSTGNATFTPMVSLPILLALLGVLVIALAIPIRRATRGRASTPLDPFRAVRVAMLAKAASVVGAAVGGIGIGLLIFLLTRPVIPSLGSMGTIIATIVACAALVAAALVAENLCTIRKDDDDDQPGTGASGGDAVVP
jgi:predicted lysophospholipase L1 biosynthesis ABC-type transport system permease subunit